MTEQFLNCSSSNNLGTILHLVLLPEHYYLVKAEHCYFVKFQSGSLFVIYIEKDIFLAVNEIKLSSITSCLQDGYIVPFF